uniref:Putative secreted protein n=1 Tax=Panstrongylus lignarius TaxID=156445 RepID=A0A224XXS4_9HEMI
MMKQFLILVSALVLAQGLEVGEIPKYAIEKNAEVWLGSLMQEYFELNNLIEEVKQHQHTQKMSSLVLAERLAKVSPDCLQTDSPVPDVWDSDACNTLTQSVAKAVNLAHTIANWTYQAGAKICGKFLDALHCGNINLVKAVQCFVNDLKDLKELIAGYKPDLLTYKEEVVGLAKELRVEFKKCLAAQKQAQDVAEQVIVQAELCDDDRKLQKLH